MRKGQFFLIGSVILIGVIASLTISRGFYSASEISVGPEILKNVANEFPKSINAILSQSTGNKFLERNLRSYMEFQNFYLKKRGLNARTYFLVGVSASDELNITLGNFYGGVADIKIRVGSQVQQTDLLTDQIKTLNFYGIPEFFEVELNLTKEGENFSHKFMASQKVFTILKIEADFKDNHYEEIEIN